METLLVIPARGHSKGVPRKNARMICGLPLIAHSIMAAKQACRVNRVVVSTDAPEIMEISANYGADIVERPVELAGDMASSEAALLHVLNDLKEKEGYVPDLLLFLQCTSPLTLPEDIDGLVDVLEKEGADTAFAASNFHYFLWSTSKEDGAIGINHDKAYRPMRQERDTQFLEAGAVYAMRTDGFLKEKHRFFGKTALYEIPEDRVMEIDTHFDFILAELLLRKRIHDQASQLAWPLGALVMDFDGVFTDNTVYVLEDGSEAVRCSRGDGLGLSELRRLSFPLLVLSSEVNPVVAARCEKLKIECIQGQGDKLNTLIQWLDNKHIGLESVAYIGNDLNDLDCLNAVGCSIAVQDAVEAVRLASRIVLSKPGGKGALRELCDLILRRFDQEESRG